MAIHIQDQALERSAMKGPLMKSETMPFKQGKSIDRRSVVKGIAGLAALGGIHIVEEPASVYRDRRMLDAFIYQWQFFAKRYKGIASTELSFNLVNEPDDKGAPDEADGRKNYARVARQTIDAICAIDPQR